MRYTKDQEIMDAGKLVLEAWAEYLKNPEGRYEGRRLQNMIEYSNKLMEEDKK